MDDGNHGEGPPKQTRSDFAHSITKGVIGSVPIIGSTIGELFSWFVRSPLEKRRDSWMEEVEDALRTLQQRGFNLEALQSDDRFVTVLADISKRALRTHETEKRQTLKNALLNSAAVVPTETALHDIFLNAIEDLSVLHLQVLKWFGGYDVFPIPRIGKSDVRTLIRSAFPESEAQGDVFDVIFNDLIRMRFLRDIGLGGGSAITDLGKKFITFVSE